jgi:acetyl-CoA synthetase
MADDRIFPPAQQFAAQANATEDWYDRAGADREAFWAEQAERVDDVMNMSGHRISTAEVESALVSHPTVAEAAVIGASDPTIGQAIVAFVIPRGSAAGDEAELEMTINALRDHVSTEIGPIAKPEQIFVVDELPKTRSGKIMRRLLRDVAENRQV